MHDGLKVRIVNETTELSTLPPPFLAAQQGTTLVNPAPYKVIGQISCSFPIPRATSADPYITFEAIDRLCWHELVQRN